MHRCTLLALLAAGLAVPSSALAETLGLPTVELPQDQAEVGEAQADGEAEPVDEGPGPRTSFWSGWSRTIELGLDGATGNTEAFNFRFATSTMRETDYLRTELSGTYDFGTNDGEESKNQARVLGVNDWKVPGKRHFYFGRGVYDFDEFQDWDSRLQLFGGVGYEILKERSLLDGGTDKADLRGRAGAGATREFGGVDNSWRPEALIGIEFDWMINERSSFDAYSNFFPALDDLDARIESGANYDILLSEEDSLTLRLGVEHRYDTEPGDANRSDFEYYILLVYEF
ncbi:MAG: DUF481 domain-containing protein [Planctomycetota bacterium]